ncbi:hypothetical protein [Streptomyces sp. NPDC058291]|uniref:hypothetical protein n=1 Tax=Streptomyces sp. NPDC058291 TaxID=3346427 RepID=UPI0036E6A2AA
MASGGEDGTVRLWEVPADGPVALRATLLGLPGCRAAGLPGCRAAGLSGGWAALAPSGGYKYEGDVTGPASSGTRSACAGSSRGSWTVSSPGCACRWRSRCGEERPLLEPPKSVIRAPSRPSPGCDVRHCRRRGPG